jgi:hypothetical protein
MTNYLVGCISAIITFCLLVAYAAYLIGNDNPYDYGNSGFLIQNDMAKIIAGLVIGVLASIIDFFLQEKRLFIMNA